jgi:hypothetical protein
MKLPLVFTVAGGTLTALEAGREDGDIDEAGFGKPEKPRTLETRTEQATGQNRSENKTEMLMRDAIMKAG